MIIIIIIISIKKLPEVMSQRSDKTNLSKNTDSALARSDTK